MNYTVLYYFSFTFRWHFSLRTSSISPGEFTKKDLGRTTSASRSDPLGSTLILAVVFTRRSYITLPALSDALCVCRRDAFHSFCHLGSYITKPWGLTACDYPQLRTRSAPARQLLAVLATCSHTTLHTVSPPFWVEAVLYQVINLVTLHIVTYITLKNWPLL